MAVAAPLTPSRFGSSLQHGSIAFPGDALAVSLPSVDFGFNELREQMAAFTLRFDDFIARGRKRVLDQRNEFRMNTAELHGNLSTYSVDSHDTDRKQNHSEHVDKRYRIAKQNLRIMHTQSRRKHRR